MSSGFEQYGQCSGHWYESSAISVNGLRGGIHHQPSLSQGADQLVDVVANIGPVVAGAERVGDLVQRPLAVAQLEDLHRGGVEPHGALGNEQEVLLAHPVVPKPCAGHETRASHGSCPGGWVSPRSIASSCAHSTSVLKRSAATAAVCRSRVPQRSTVRSSAY